MPRLRGIDLPELLSVQGSGMRGAGVKPSARASNAKPHADAAVHPRIRAPAAAQPKAPPRAHAGEPRRPQQQHVSEHGRRVVAPIVARGQGFGGGVSVMNVQFPANASRGGADAREWDRRGGPGACPGGGALTRGDARRGAGYPNAARGGRHAALRRPASARRRRPDATDRAREDASRGVGGDDARLRQQRAAELGRIMRARDEARRRERETHARDALQVAIASVGVASDEDALRALEDATRGAKAAGISGAGGADLLSQAVDAARGVKRREAFRVTLRAAVERDERGDGETSPSSLLTRAEALGFRADDPEVVALEDIVRRRMAAARDSRAEHRDREMTDDRLAAQETTSTASEEDERRGVDEKNAAAAAAAAAAPQGKRRVLQGNLEVQAIIGEGAYGVVLKCHNLQTNETVAVKEFKINSDDPDVEEVKRTSTREVEILRNLKHENIVSHLGDFYVGERLYVVMEYVPKTLLELLDECGGRGLSKEFVKSCMFQLCKAITFIHGGKYVYRDVKPENVLVDPHGVVKLCDFGFARSVEGNGEDGVLTDYVATRWYRAPELLLGPPYDNSGESVRTKYGPGVDMWAIGCLMCELTDGEPIFPGDSDIDQLIRIQRCLGKLTPGQMMAFSVNPNNAGVNFDELPPHDPEDGLVGRYAGVMDDVELEFITGLLSVNPRERFTGAMCCRHELFADIAEARAYVKVLDEGGF